MVKKVFALALAILMAVSCAACSGSSAPAAAPAAAAPAEAKAPELMEAAFLCGDEMLFMEADGTCAVVRKDTYACTDGTYTVSGDGYSFAIPGSGLDGKQLPYIGGRLGDNNILPIYSRFRGQDREDGYVIRRDGTFEYYKNFEAETGKVIGTWFREGGSWTLVSPIFGRKAASFDGKNWTIDGITFEYSSNMGKLNAVNHLLFNNVYVNGEQQLGLMFSSLNDAVKRGFRISDSIDSLVLQPGEISRDITVTFAGATAAVRVINGFGTAKPASECFICRFYTTDTYRVFAINQSGDTVGDELYDQLLEHRVYSYTPGRLVYKVNLMPALHFEQGVVTEAGTKVDMVLDFEGTKLTAFSFEYSGLLYGADVPTEPVEPVQEEKIETAREIRADILGELEKGFAEEGITVAVDRATGEITMDNKILFKINSSDLSPEGKDYIDRFIGVYARVLLHGGHADAVTGIRFEGHTDSSGRYGFNMYLSETRANTVRDYALSGEGSGLAAEDLAAMEQLSEAVGYASSNPVLDANGNENAEASRRVTVRFFIQAK